MPRDGRDYGGPGNVGLGLVLRTSAGVHPDGAGSDDAVPVLPFEVGPSLQQALQQGQNKGGGFTGSGLSGGQKIPAFEEDGNGLGLDGRRLGISQLVQCF
jgi:hypothetical protein